MSTYRLKFRPISTHQHLICFYEYSHDLLDATFYHIHYKFVIAKERALIQMHLMVLANIILSLPLLLMKPITLLNNPIFYLYCHLFFIFVVMLIYFLGVGATPVFLFNYSNLFYRMYIWRSDAYNSLNVLLKHLY